jgi:hypothetical protein
MWELEVGRDISKVPEIVGVIIPFLYDFTYEREVEKGSYEEGLSVQVPHDKRESGQSSPKKLKTVGQSSSQAQLQIEGCFTKGGDDKSTKINLSVSEFPKSSYISRLPKGERNMPPWLIMWLRVINLLKTKRKSVKWVWWTQKERGSRAYLELKYLKKIMILRRVKVAKQIQWGRRIIRREISTRQGWTAKRKWMKRRLKMEQNLWGV